MLSYTVIVQPYHYEPRRPTITIASVDSEIETSTEDESGGEIDRLGGKNQLVRKSISRYRITLNYLLGI